MNFSYAVNCPVCAASLKSQKWHVLNAEQSLPGISNPVNSAVLTTG
jgi:hypothetical protein